MIRKCASPMVKCFANDEKLAKFMYQDNLRNQSEKEIYKPGALRIVSNYLTIRVSVYIWIHACQR
jgi:hypothetical protein